MSESSKNSAVVGAFEELCAQTVKTAQGYLEQALAASQIVARAATAEQVSAVAAFNSFVGAYRAQAEAFVPFASNLFSTPPAEVDFKGLFSGAVDRAVESSREAAVYAAGVLDRQSETGKALAQPAANALEATIELVRSAASQSGVVAEWLAAQPSRAAEAAAEG